MKWLAINAWLFAKDPLSVLQITLKSQRIALLIKYIHISVRAILLVLLPLFEAWKESCGGIFSMIADSRDCDKILRLALTLSTAQRNATSCLLSARSKRPPGKRNKRVTLQYHMCIMAFVKKKLQSDLAQPSQPQLLFNYPPHLLKHARVASSKYVLCITPLYSSKNTKTKQNLIVLRYIRLLMQSLSTKGTFLFYFVTNQLTLDVKKLKRRFKTQSIRDQGIKLSEMYLKMYIIFLNKVVCIEFQSFL